MQLGLVKAHLQGGIGVLQLYIMKLKGLSDSISEPLTLRMNGIDRWLEGPTGEGEKRILTYGTFVLLFLVFSIKIKSTFMAP